MSRAGLAKHAIPRAVIPWKWDIGRERARQVGTPAQGLSSRRVRGGGGTSFWAPSVFTPHIIPNLANHMRAWTVQSNTSNTLQPGVRSLIPLPFFCISSPPCPTNALPSRLKLPASSSGGRLVFTTHCSTARTLTGYVIGPALQPRKAALHRRAGRLQAGDPPHFLPVRRPREEAVGIPLATLQEWNALAYIRRVSTVPRNAPLLSLTRACSLDPVQVTQMAKYLETVYVSGWQSSSTASSSNEPGPDLAGTPRVLISCPQCV